MLYVKHATDDGIHDEFPIHGNSAPVGIGMHKAPPTHGCIPARSSPPRLSRPPSSYLVNTRATLGASQHTLQSSREVAIKPLHPTTRSKYIYIQHIHDMIYNTQHVARRCTQCTTRSTHHTSPNTPRKQLIAHSTHTACSPTVMLQIAVLPCLHGATESSLQTHLLPSRGLSTHHIITHNCTPYYLPSLPVCHCRYPGVHVNVQAMDNGSQIKLTSLSTSALSHA
jgi:hypothetical protein